MRKSREFLGVLISVLVCVFIVGIVVYATTTVSDDITIGADLTVTSGARIGTGTSPGHVTALDTDSLLIEGVLEVDGIAYLDGFLQINNGTGAPATELSVVGTASISEDIWASGSFQFGGGEGTATKSYSRLGSEAATSHSFNNADDLLITGQLEVDGTTYFDGNVSLSDSSSLLVGDGATITSGTASKTGACTIGSIYLRTGLASMGLIFNVCDETDKWTSLASEADNLNW